VGVAWSPPHALETLVAEGVSKTFRLPHEQVHTLKERVLHPFRGRRVDELQALSDVSFTVHEGEFFGIVGRNGSGKSTLLKCLAGIYGTDSGRILLRGRMATFIELGVGFNPDLTARDNVVINAIMLGLTPAEARARYDAVIDFAELGEFEDLKLKNYSSGMYVRLAFATMIQVDANILLIDEVLAVGDVSFQQKCHEVLADIRRRGRTILFVTHDMATVEAHCDRALLLERGDPMECGDPNRIARMYDRLNFSRRMDSPADDDLRMGDGAAAVVDAWFEDEHGLRSATIERGRPCTVHVLVEFRAPAVHPILGFSIGNEHTPRVFTTTSLQQDGETGRFEAGERAELVTELTMPLAPGRYSLTPYVRHEGTKSRLMDLRESWVPITIIGERASGGLVDVPHEAKVRRVGTVAEVAE
jgi:ABC-type polysaccharide/polyol phosphate transport system ATPase subunit